MLWDFVACASAAGGAPPLVHLSHDPASGHQPRVRLPTVPIAIMKRRRTVEDDYKQLPTNS